MVDVKVEMPNISEKFNRILNEELNKANDILSKYLLEYAKTHHNFTSRTGILVSSIKVKGTLQTGLELYLDLNVANYGDDIVEGANGKKPDDFITKTLTDNEAKINKVINDAVNAACLKMNGY